MSTTKPKRVRPASTRGTERNRLGTPERERARPLLAVRLDRAVREALDATAQREHVTVGELLSRWVAAGCPLGSVS